ncbi:MAG TPA: LysR family transcriptional regulator [Thermoanaerobacterales bacterium]|nr:LysR family transcriptional regulator [Thermoanaerobacterales bacterium]
MDFHQLEAFIKVAEYNSFSRAAEALFLTQPTISSHVISLEKELNIKLFDRRGKDIELTPAGNIFLKKAINVLKARETAIKELRYYLGAVEGEIKVYASTIPAVYILPSFIKEFNKIYPDVFFSIKQVDSGEVINAVLNDEVEVGVVGTSACGKELSYTPFCEDELVLITPYSYNRKWCSKDTVEIKDIIKEKFVLREKMSGTRHTFEKAINKQNISINSFNVVAEFGSSEAILQAVKQGLGISIISDKVIGDYCKMKFIKAFKISNLDLSRRFYLVHKTGRTLSPNTKALKQLIVKLNKK